MEQIKKRLELLRDAMKNAGVSACIIPGTDPHASEYIADYWKERVWISGFTGSAGTAVVGLGKAGLWTDSRYFLQGAEQLAGTGIDLMKLAQPGTPDIISWLSSELKAGERVGVNAQMFSVNAYAAMKAELKAAGVELVSIDLLAQVWTDRPALPSDPFFVFDSQYAGKSVAEKLQSLRGQMKKEHAGVFVLSALDEIVWLFNIRGNDVSYNPVVISYALVTEDKATLFVASEKVTPEATAFLQSEGVSVAPYADIHKALKAIPVSESVLLDGAKLNQSLFEAIPSGCGICNRLSPVNKMKSIKNAVEIEGYRRAMVEDGVALTRFYMWLEENVHTGDHTELSIDKQLCKFRSMGKNFMGESFGSIVGYGPHGAVVHYSATPESASTLKAENILLIDSGGQYLDGTTDITRTIALGTPTVQQKMDFTLVLKGNIALDTAIFPVNTRGSQIDILARKAMWDLGLNYGHGTGHGVGHFLNVHEGPQSIRAEENSVVLEPGMVMSNEPGLYRTDQYGVRTENMMVVVPAQTTEFGQFLKFETLTLCPIDQELIDLEIMTPAEIDWINNYHQKVYDKISPLLNEDERDWLSRKCAKLR
jgi:Xaa-Pro aminopeptidase